MKNSINIQKSAQSATKPRVYICSPYRPTNSNPILAANELIDNLKLAKDACTFAALRLLLRTSSIRSSSMTTIRPSARSAWGWD